MSAFFVIQTSPEEKQACILIDVQLLIDRLRSEFSTPIPQYLTQAETAHLLHVDIRTARTWTRKGLLHAYRFGTRVFYKRQEVIQQLATPKAGRP